MNVREFKSELAKVNPSFKIIMASDAEGNNAHEFDYFTILVGKGTIKLYPKHEVI